MAFSDPQTFNALTLPRISSGINAGAFATADGTTNLSVAHTYGSRTRRVIRVDFKKLVPDTLVPSTNVVRSMSAYVVVDHPIQGFTNAELKVQVDALVAYLTASTGAKVTQLLGGEN